MEVSLDYKPAEPSKEMMAFLSCLEDTDPNDNLIDNNNKGVSWGHYHMGVV